MFVTGRRLGKYSRVYINRKVAKLGLALCLCLTNFSSQFLCLRVRAGAYPRVENLMFYCNFFPDGKGNPLQCCSGSSGGFPEFSPDDTRSVV
jgi:hypothetical protein